MNFDHLHPRQSIDARKIKEPIVVNLGDWVICGYLEDHWEKYPDCYSNGSKNRPEQVDRLESQWVYLKNGMFVDHEYVRLATDLEVTDWLQYLARNENTGQN